MKTILALAIAFPFFATAAAELPKAGSYSCGSFRAFQNTPESTKDNMTIDLWYNQKGQPVLRIVTKGESVSPVASVVGGDKTVALDPVKPQYCTYEYPDLRLQGCSIARLPVLNDSQNLFIKPGQQRVVAVKLTSPFQYISSKHLYKKRTEHMAVEVDYRKNDSHWERTYACELL